MSPRIIIVNDLTTISLLDVFADKDHIAPKLNLVNVPGLNYLLRSEMFASEDVQLQAAHLILDYEPLSRIFQDVGQALKAGNPRLARVDVFKPGFLAQRDLPPVVLSPQRVPQQVATPREESASSHHSLDAEIDQFLFKEEEGALERPVELSDSKTESDRFSTVHHPRLIVAQLDTSSEGEEEGMDLKQRTSLKGLLANRNKGSTSKEIPKTQVPFSLPSPPPSPLLTLD